jgi:hypothetical protein
MVSYYIVIIDKTSFSRGKTADTEDVLDWGVELHYHTPIRAIMCASIPARYIVYCYYVLHLLHHAFTALLLLYSIFCTETLD